MKKDDAVIVNKQPAVIIGLSGDLYHNTSLNKEVKVPPNMIRVMVNASNAVLIFPTSQVKAA